MELRFTPSEKRVSHRISGMLSRFGAAKDAGEAETFLEVGGPHASPRQWEYLACESVRSRAQMMADAAPAYFFSRARTISGGSSEI